MKRSRRTGASTSSRNLSGRDTRTPAGPGLGRSRILSTPGTRRARSQWRRIRFDIRAKVYRSSTQLVGSGQSTSVSGGSSGFNNAKQDTIALTSAGGVRFMPGESLSIKIYIRNACSGSGKNAGTARVWFDDSSANSRFSASIGTSKTYFLREVFALATTAGVGPKKTIDVAAGAKCSPYKTFGAWSITIP